ncbi:growth-regulated protein homolog gamma-like isoform X6 [Lutra lutra]|uniref:growth-regulated protein homolog gamma-like isoform X6 n=1 Tax=Lutra lutra TaxID=9657 RepID=UPI001FD42E93|nr:growth-regulated protein homolog gamma-like isoform X6 [Lutra lutra]
MARAAAAPRALRLLGAALLLLLLLPAGRRAAGAPVAAELRCQCLQTVQAIHLKNIQNVVVTPSGPHCEQTEVIATLKNGQEVCLNPEAPLVKKLINKMLNKMAFDLLPSESSLIEGQELVDEYSILQSLDWTIPEVTLVPLKDGALICLDPEAEWVMIVIKKIINRRGWPRRREGGNIENKASRED